MRKTANIHIKLKKTLNQTLPKSIDLRVTSVINSLLLTEISNNLLERMYCGTIPNHLII